MGFAHQLQRAAADDTPRAAGLQLNTDQRVNHRVADLGDEATARRSGGQGAYPPHFVNDNHNQVKYVVVSMFPNIIMSINQIVMSIIVININMVIVIMSLSLIMVIVIMSLSLIIMNICHFHMVINYRGSLIQRL